MRTATRTSWGSFDFRSVRAPALTRAECRVLELVASGLSSREIAAILTVSRQTVTYHIGHLLMKLDAKSRTGLVARAYAIGLIPPGDWPPHIDGPSWPRRLRAPSPPGI